MLSHICIGITDFPRAFAFYSSLMEILRYPLRMKNEEHVFAGWEPAGGGYPRVFIGTPFDGQPASVGNGQMVAFLAANRQIVDDCHAMALAQGGVCEGPPGPRAHYHPDYYGAYFRDPDGNKLCVCCHTPAPDLTES